MTLDAVDRESNVRDSIKKYLVDCLEIGESIPTTFDTELTIPNTTDPEVKKWLTVIWGSLHKVNKINHYEISLYCCVREDREGFKLTQFRDKVMGYMTDNSQTDCMRRIDLYQSSPTAPWVKIGGMVVDSVREAGDINAPDGSKYKRLIFSFMWGGK